MKYKLLSILLLILVIITQTSCGKKEEVSATDFYLDTSCTITIYNVDKSSGEELTRKAFYLCDKYEKMLSKTVSGSDIDKINKAEGNWVAVNNETKEILEEAIKLGDISGGEFDITVGRITDLWDFKSENPKVPDQGKINDAVATVDYKQIKIDGNKVRLQNPEAKIDLGAIAKGYIADKITEMLIDEGVTCAIINLGGNVVAIGEKEDKTPWKIGVERPYSDRSQVIGSINAKNQTIVTSGIYERNFKYDGKLYHHIIDPKTGYPVENNVEAVTIVGKLGNSMLCDGYSTLSLLIGVDEGKRLIEAEDDLEAIFITDDDKEIKTKGIKLNK